MISQKYFLYLLEDACKRVQQRALIIHTDQLSYFHRPVMYFHAIIYHRDPNSDIPKIKYNNYITKNTEINIIPTEIRNKKLKWDLCHFIVFTVLSQFTLVILFNFKPEIWKIQQHNNWAKKKSHHLELFQSTFSR